MKACAAFAIGLAVAAAGCAPAVPDALTYTRDVQPILAAHCVRCHGANDTLNAIPGISTPMPAPRVCYLQAYESNPMDCTVEPTCQHGAKYCANLIPTYIDIADDAPLRMPPKPSDPLSDWEKDVLLHWASMDPPAL